MRRLSDIAVISIVGAGNSGSTALCASLGRYRSVISVGEIGAIDDFRARGVPCACGALFEECEFWAPILSRLETNRNVRLPAAVNRQDDVMAAERNFDLFGQIADTTGCRIIVDSSKDVSRLKGLAKHGAVKLVPVHLIRDGRAYISSVRRRLKADPGRATLRRRILLPVFATLKWKRMNSAAEAYIAAAPRGAGLTVIYEQLTRKPGRVLPQILALGGIEPGTAPHDFSENSHQVGGTAVRAGRVVTGLQPDGDLTTRDDRDGQLTFWDGLVYRVLGGDRLYRRISRRAAKQA
jgi:hypothetical protein